MRYFLLIVVMATLLFVGCDDRGTENPKMYVTAESEYGNFVYNKVGFNEMTFHFQLDGPNSKLIERKINVNNSNDMGSFIGTGSSLFVITDENGYAEGRFFARDGYGIANLEFVLDDWQSENVTFSIPIFDFPAIDSLVATTYTLDADGISSTGISAYISSENIDFGNSDNQIKILFEAAQGELTQTISTVDVLGIASSNFIAPNQPANVKVKAKLDLYPAIYKSITIKCE